QRERKLRLDAVVGESPGGEALRGPENERSWQRRARRLGRGVFRADPHSPDRAELCSDGVLDRISVGNRSRAHVLGQRRRPPPAMSHCEQELRGGAHSGGHRCAQGAAVSYSSANTQSLSSWPAGATSWKPIGRPAADGSHGRLTAAQPAALTNGVYTAWPRGPASLPAIVDGYTSCAGHGSAAADGVSMTSYCANVSP